MNEATNFFSANAKALLGIAVVGGLLIALFILAKNRGEKLDKRAGQTSDKVFDKMDAEVGK